MRRIYFAFTDPSGGSSDSFTLAIAHVSILKHAVLDLFIEKRPPFSPDAVVEEFASVLKTYKVMAVTGDRFGGEWPRERFRVHGIEYIASEKTKSEIYTAFLVLVNSARTRIPGDKKLRAQLQALERRSSRTGRDTVDHAVGGHDDIANAAAGALVLAASALTPAPEPWSWVPTSDPAPPRSSFENLSPTDEGPSRWWHKLN
jgi:hypothetical protein